MARPPSFLNPLRREPNEPWILRDADTGADVACRLELAGTSATRRRGLLGRDGLDEGHALIIAPCSAIHTWFMRFPIDVLFVGREGRVLKTRQNVVPWRLSGSWGAYAVVELAAGALVRSRTLAGHQLVIERSGS